jgi:hypothetical protein
MLPRRNRPPHRWRPRDAERHFVISYLGIAEEQAAKQGAPPQRWRYEAAVFRLDGSSDATLLWVADEATGPRSQSIEGVHGGIRRDLWTANQEAIEWVRLAGELGEIQEVHSYATLAEFEHAVDGLVGATIPSIPRDLGLHSPVEERSFDLWDTAFNRPVDPEVH